jgi:hypothetical protein
MASYVVMEPPGRDGEAMLVRDGFHFFAFLIPFGWLLWHRLWFEGLIALGAALALSMLGSVVGFTTAAPLLSVLVGIYVGLEGTTLKVNAFARRGWREWGVVEADNAEDAEIRYLSAAYGDEPTDELWLAPPLRPSGRAVPNSGLALGMLTYPGRN